MFVGSPEIKMLASLPDIVFFFAEREREKPKIHRLVVVAVNHSFVVCSLYGVLPVYIFIIQ